MMEVSNIFFIIICQFPVSFLNPVIKLTFVMIILINVKSMFRILPIFNNSYINAFSFFRMIRESDFFAIIVFDVSSPKK